MWSIMKNRFFTDMNIWWYIKVMWKWNNFSLYRSVLPIHDMWSL